MVVEKEVKAAAAARVVKVAVKAKKVVLVERLAMVVDPSSAPSRMRPRSASPGDRHCRHLRRYPF